MDCRSLNITLVLNLVLILSCSTVHAENELLMARPQATDNDNNTLTNREDSQQNILSQEQELQNNNETMVIIGKVPRPIQDVFGAASVINREQIENELMHDISDLVRYEAGISIESAGNRFGLSGFSIRGIGGNRIATEIDGIPVADQFSIGSYSNSGRNFIDIDLVQQVEILRGPASSVYGSNAIGGVVSFVTKKPVDLLSQSSNDYYLGLKAGYYGIDNSRLISANTAFASGRSSGLLTLSMTDGHEFDNPLSDDLTDDNQDKNTQSLLAKYYFDLSDNQQLSISYDYYNKDSDTNIESLLGFGRFRTTTELKGIDQSERNNLSANYQFTSDINWLDGGVIRLYKQSTKTEQLSIEQRASRGTDYLYQRDFSYQQDIDGIRINLFSEAASESLVHKIGYGIEWSDKKVTELRDSLQTNLSTGDSTNLILSEEFPLRDFPISNITELGIYINDEIEIENFGITIIPAVRYDNYELVPKPDDIYISDNPATNVIAIQESHLSTKLGLQYEFNWQHRWFIQYFEGFRSPPFEDANIGLDIPLFNVRAIPNPDLKSESSAGFELGYRYASSTHQVDLIGFYTDYDDFIQTKVNLGFDPVSQRILFQSQNIDSAKIYGNEVQYRYKTADWFQQGDSIKFYANSFWSKGKNGETNQPINNLEPNHLLLGLNWMNVTRDWSIALHTSFYSAKKDLAELDDPNEVLFRTSGYSVTDLIVNYQINENTKISGAIYNLFDRQYWHWSDVDGLLINDPLLNSLSASGINGSFQIRINL